MISHKSPISGIASTKDGKYVATAGYDNVVILWDAEKKCSVARGCHDHLANQCVFSSDGEFLASSGSDYTVRIWSVPSMSLKAVLTGHTDDVEGLSFNEEKQLIATCSRDKTIKLFKLNGEQVKTLKGHTADVISVEWMSGTDVIISSSDDGTVKYWNTLTGEIIKDLSFNDVETDTIALTGDGVIFAGNDEGEIVLIKEDQEPVMIPCHEAGIKRLVFSESVNKLVSLSYDRTFKVWNYNNGELTHAATHSFENIVWPRSAAFLNEKEIVFASFGDRYAHFDLEKGVWNNENIVVTHGVNCVCEYNGDIYTVGDAGFIRKNGEIINRLGSLCNFITPFTDQLIAGGQTGEIFNAFTGEVIVQHKSPLNCGSEYVVDGQPRIVIGSYTGEAIMLVKGDDGKIRFEKNVKLQENAIKGIGVSEDYIFSVCATGAAAFHDKATLEEVRFIKEGHNQIANGCVELADNTFASVSRDLCLRIWSLSDVECFETSHKNSIKCVSSDSSGRYIMLGDYTGHISLFDVSSKQFIEYTRLSEFGISNIGFNSQTNEFMASSYNGKVYMVALPDAEENQGQLVEKELSFA